MGKNSNMFCCMLWLMLLCKILWILLDRLWIKTLKLHNYGLDRLCNVVYFVLHDLIVYVM